MKQNTPVRLTDKEIDALANVVTLALIRAFERGDNCHHLTTAITKIEQSRQKREIEIPAERLKALE